MSQTQTYQNRGALILSVRYQDGVKQDAVGTYYLRDYLDSNGNILYSDNYYLETEDDLTLPVILAIDLRSRQSGGGHVWHVTKYEHFPVDCRSPSCNICNRYHQDNRNTYTVEAV